MNIELCLFDLDNTLLLTDDLKSFRGVNNINNNSNYYTNNLRDSFLNHNGNRYLYSIEELNILKMEFPSLKWGVFTRSPRHYAKTLLSYAYPEFEWDVIIAFEDVQNTKPYPDGIVQAAYKLGIQFPPQVVLVGDEKTDVDCAYRAGCWVFIDQSSWPDHWSKEQWRVKKRMPDAMFKGAKTLHDLLVSPHLKLPILEYLIAGGQRKFRGGYRFDKINHFFPTSLGGGYVPIHVMGRLFGEYKNIRPRREWHDLTNQILNHKNAIQFPEAWVQSIKFFLDSNISGNEEIIVTVIPFKPGRLPRLEHLLSMVAEGYEIPISFRPSVKSISFVEDVMSFRQGAISSHSNHLNADQRFNNVGNHLQVIQPDMVKGKHIIVIDDVVTSGATLLWAHRYLLESGAKSVACVSLAQAIGEM